MVCNSCGEEIGNGKSFCEKCGCGVNDASVGGNIKKNKKKRNIIIGIIGIIVILWAIGHHIQPNKYVENVKTDTFTDYPNVPVGKAFDSFFTDPEWSYFVSSDGKNIVEFKGGCVYDGQNVNALVQFEVNEDGSFKIEYFSMNNISQNILMIAGLVDKVADSYNAKAS